jgi:NADP-reducing hydrogenase subunit HndC
LSLAGSINHAGTIEVPMGTTLREIIFDIGGGLKDNKKLKAVQTGGPSGGFFPAEKINVPVDFDAISQAGSTMGRGGVLVMDERTCMVDVARHSLAVSLEESCGKCAPCRVGTRQMFGMLDRITKGRGQDGDIERLEELAKTVKTASLCDLGQNAPNPVLTTLGAFRKEYEAHIKEKNCQAQVCRGLTGGKKKAKILPKRKTGRRAK